MVPPKMTRRRLDLTKNSAVDSRIEDAGRVHPTRVKRDTYILDRVIIGIAFLSNV